MSELPEDAPERTLALPVLLRLRLEVTANPARTRDDQEFLMDTQDIVEKWRNEAIQEGRRQGAEGALAATVIEFYEDRFGTMPTELRAVVEAMHDERTLRGWIKLAGTGSAEELAAIVRGSRAS